MAGRVAALGRAGIRVAGQAGVVIARVARPALATLANVANRGLNSILARADMILPAIFFGTMIDWDELIGIDLVNALRSNVKLLYDYDNDALYYEDFDTGVSTYYDDDIEEINQQIKDALEYAGYDLEADFGLAGSSPSAMAMRNKKFDKIAKKYPKPREMSNDMYSVYISAINHNLYEKPKKARSKKPMPKPMPIVSKGSGRMCPKCGMPSGGVEPPTIINIPPPNVHRPRPIRHPVLEEIIRKARIRQPIRFQ
jgi:hypothetical protein